MRIILLVILTLLVGIEGLLIELKLIDRYEKYQEGKNGKRKNDNA